MRLKMHLSLIVLLTFAFFCFPAARHAQPAVITPYDCEGNACPAVTFVWDQERQQFRVENTSDNPVKVEVSTFAGKSHITVPPKKVGYLEVKSFNGPYRATYE